MFCPASSGLKLQAVPLLRCFLLESFNHFIGFLLQNLVFLHRLLDGLNAGIDQLLAQLLNSKPLFLGNVGKLLSLLQFSLELIGAHPQGLGQLVQPFPVEPFLCTLSRMQETPHREELALLLGFVNHLQSGLLDGVHQFALLHPQVGSQFLQE